MLLSSKRSGLNREVGLEDEISIVEIVVEDKGGRADVDEGVVTSTTSSGIILELLDCGSKK